MRMLRSTVITPGVTGKDNIRNEHIRGALEVDMSGQKVRQSRLRWHGQVTHHDEDGRGPIWAERCWKFRCRNTGETEEEVGPIWV